MFRTTTRRITKLHPAQAQQINKRTTQTSHTSHTSKFNPAELHRFILAEFPAYIKKTFLTPNKLAFQYFNRKNRDETLKAIYRAFWDRQQGRILRPSDRLSNPIVATQCAPGGGKSFLLDELAALREADFELCSSYPDGEQMKEMLRKCVAIPITFNSGTSVNYNVEEKNSDKICSLRMLYNFYLEQDTLPFDKFRKQLSYMLPSDISDTLETIRYTLSITNPEKTNIILCVDELLKSEMEHEILKLLGGLLDQNGWFHCIVTTLDQLPVQHNFSNSGRPTKWIGLPRISYEDSIQMVEEALLQKKGLKLHSSHHLVINDCNGHPRSLQYAVECISDNVDSAWICLRENIANKLPRPDAKYLGPALKGELLMLNAPVDNSGPETFAHLIMHAVYLNSTVDCEAIPLMSPIQISAMKSQGNTLLTLTKKLINSLELNFHWQSYEIFHGLWECIRRCLYANETMSLSKFYKLDASDTKNLIYDPEIVIEPYHGVIQLSHEYPQKELKPSSYDYYDDERNALDNMTMQFCMEKASCVLMPAANNPNFDLILFQKTTSGKHIALVFQCRYSKPGASTTLSLDKIKDLRSKILGSFKPFLKPKESNTATTTATATPKQYSSYIESLELTENDIFLVVCSFRKTSSKIKAEMAAMIAKAIKDAEDAKNAKDAKDAKDTINKLRNTIILTKEQLEELYSPTLARCPQFILSNATIDYENENEEH